LALSTPRALRVCARLAVGVCVAVRLGGSAGLRYAVRIDLGDKTSIGTGAGCTIGAADVVELVDSDADAVAEAPPASVVVTILAIIHLAARIRFGGAGCGLGSRAGNGAGRPLTLSSTDEPIHLLQAGVR